MIATSKDKLSLKHNVAQTQRNQPTTINDFSISSLNLAQEIAKIGSWDYDTETDYVYCSESLLKILGLTCKGTRVPKYEDLFKMIYPEDRATFNDLFQRTKQSGVKMDLEYRIQTPDQTIIIVHVRAIPKKNANGDIVRIIGVLYDISEQVIIENRLKETEIRFNTIAENLDVGIWSMNYVTKELVYASPGLAMLTGYTPTEFLSETIRWKDLVHPEDLADFLKSQSKLIQGLYHEYRIIDASGEVKWMEDKVFPIVNSEGHIVRLDGIVQDITERKRTEEEIHFLAYHDYLTQLPNRRMFDQKLEQVISDYQGRSDRFALFYLDMDRFKLANDTLGHEIGDLLLRKIAKRLSSAAGDNEVFRMGGDEFTIIQTNLDRKRPRALAKEILSEINRPFYIDGYEIHLTTSIGIGIFPDDESSLKKLKMNADAALYRAKELGKNNVQFSNKTFNRESYKRFQMENDLRKALLKQEFVLHYQSRVDAQTGEIVGAEALIRWNHPKLGLVSPAEFIPVAEETGFINEMSEWIVEQVCKQLSDWRAKGYSLVPISINLSAKTLMKVDLVKKIMAMLADYSISPSLIEIEITEESLIKNEGTAMATIQSLRELGFVIALDDFGTGYSSIGYLKKFKVDVIKIDRSFIKDIHENNEDSAIVQSIILLAKGLGLKIVAEGVETEKQWHLLQSLKCHFIQGYLFSKPQPAEEFVLLLMHESVSVY